MAPESLPPWRDSPRRRTRGQIALRLFQVKLLTRRDAMTCRDEVGDERARRFRDLTLPCLDDAYRLAYFLMRNRTDAEDAVQECYLRALRHFDTYRGPAIKPWLLAVLRNVCYGALSRRRQQEPLADEEDAA